MAVKWPAANGNWSTAANWNDGTKPTTGDTVHADGKTITIDENVDLGAGSKLTTETRSGGSAGGGFTFSGDYTITVANLVSNVASACLTFTGSGTGAVVNANGTASLNNAACIALNHTGSGTLTAVGAGSSLNGARAFHNAGAGIFTITGNVSAILNSGYGALNNSTGTMSLTGVASASGSAAAAAAAGNLSTGTLNITGNPISTSTGAGSAGALNNSTGTLNVTTVGTLVANNSVVGGYGQSIRNAAAGTVVVTGNVEGSSLTPRCVAVLNAADGAVTINGSCASGRLTEGQYSNQLGACAVRNESPTVAVAVTTFTDVGAIQGKFTATTYPAIATLSYDGGATQYEYVLETGDNAQIPAEDDVRYGVEYALSRTGTCHVPPPESVALNVPVDATVGTLEAGGGGGDPEDIAEAVWAYATRTLSAGVTLADDAITAAKFDESTAFPLKSADTGATTVARTGADSDTLESLSDQLDLIDAGARPIHSGTAAAGTAQTITLDNSASSVDGFYSGQGVVIRSGTGAGQSNSIIAYAGISKVATVAQQWLTTPSSDSVFAIIAADAMPWNVSSGIATAGASTTLTLRSGDTWPTSFLIGAAVRIVSGTGRGQLRSITANTNANPSVVTVDRAWTTNPDNTSGYAILAFNDALISAGDIASSALADTKFASNAITAAKIATGAFSAAKFAADYLAAVNAEVDGALNTVIPVDPAAGSINERVETMGQRLLGTIQAGTHVAQSGDNYVAITHADYGLDKLARTGADSDTLESLSDQIDAAALEATSQTLLSNVGAIDTLVQDLPTSAEFEARTLPAADYFDPATDPVANVTLVATTTLLTTLPPLDLTPVTLAIDALNDFDPLNDVVAHVSLVDTTTAVTIPAPVDLTPVIEAIGLLNDFDPATDVVANVTLVDTTTTLTNAPNVPSAGDIAEAVWAEDVEDYAEGTAGYLLGDLHERLEEQVEEGPAVVVPAPAAGQTTVWAMCYDEDGLPEADVEIFIQCVSASGTAAVFDGATVALKSDANGLAAGPIPRSASLKFTARRGDGGKRVRFTGADADSLALPALVGTP